MFFPMFEQSFRRFAQCEDGAVSTEMMPLMLMTVGTSLGVTNIVRGAVDSVSTNITGVLAEAGIVAGMTTFASDELPENVIVVPDGDDGTYLYVDDTLILPDGNYTVAGVLTVDTSIDLSGAQPGNPGNNKAVGKAGENPNGKGGWGNGSNGQSS